MTFERCAFVLIYISLSGLSPSPSKAATSNLLDTTALRDKVILARNLVNREKSSFSESKTSVEIDRQSSYSTSDRSLELSQNSDSEPFPKVDRQWTLGAMALTASIALFLTWLLFRKPPQADLAVIADTEQESTMPETEISPSESPARATFLESNLAEEKATAPSASTWKSDLSIEAESSQGSTVQIDVVRELILDLQSADNLDWDTSVGSDSAAQISRRRKAILELTKVGDYRSIEPLLKIMPQVGELDKSLIIEAVNQITHRSFKPINERLFTDLQDRDPEVRLNAVKDLRNLYQFVAPAITKISQMQSDVDYEVRQTATQALARLNTNPLPAFDNSVKTSVEQKVNELISKEDGEANLQLVAYLLAELDVKR